VDEHTDSDKDNGIGFEQSPDDKTDDKKQEDHY
jgi:hypothetical protein